ncbi:alanine--tRNA ligase [Flavilitoribacter nigricans]|uniref:Alanine--tRNA ligase n=1 Tax=Flavilitoribacter nigricans (strain ATCC 23147 / DSM 23189 / NBRC 102662 / NCIMB 1420 / SS-2) TaxID=1122177 RepID=A0A2D0N6P6_FLAN2|nr:alanine--tRNA ligase [Flavilitoribacter nigricans]PHN04174.1 alanine--tRNA ligase [Flavilitoribacter nigricans DSM 23189 = NBRC 102662]
MTSTEIRQAFLDFFKSKDHKIVPSAPIVNKDDPTLMFTNAGMNQFKDYFLGNQVPDKRRIADTQKCLRVSGKHNDLEEVGRDGTHHTMFEMLGNWSFGDYFKKEAIAWSWELLTDVLKLPKDRLYATVFEGDAGEGLPEDSEARGFWEKILPADHVINGNKKDNFWEMGDTGPCGPCTEIHIDLRSDEDRLKVPGHELVNMDDPEVVEIWNNVFIQFNRKADGKLEPLPEKHVDTGMGFERLVMVMQGKKATYDTDIFMPFINYIEKQSGLKYQHRYAEDAKSDIAMRVVVDHIRAVAFTIADGQLPGNSGAGYVIRRILRRAVRYYYSFLNIKEPFLHTLIPQLADYFQGVFPELKAQQVQVARIIEGEEKTFLNTLENGIARFEDLEVTDGLIAGEDAFVLYDTYGFPIDLTRLMAEEKGYRVDEKGFEKALQEQKDRARADAAKAVGDWTELRSGEEVEFVGYDQLAVDDARIIKYRTVNAKGKDQYHIVLNKTPFYGESGGQAGDKGLLSIDGETIKVLDTQKENELTVHIVDRFPETLDGSVHAQVHDRMRRATEANHSAVHLMHAALHQILGEHALQKGQDVNDQRLRFDFSHFEAVKPEELQEIETMVNEKIRADIQLEEDRNMPIDQAKASGAMMLFGEKYGDEVRVITFDKDFSRELCGGTHVSATGKIGQFKILSESSVAAGIRRIEAVTAEVAEAHLRSELQALNEVRSMMKNPADVVKSIHSLQEENKALKKEIEKMLNEQAGALKDQLGSKAESINGVNFIGVKLPLNDNGAIKNLAFQLEKDVDRLVAVLGAEANGKALLTIIISRDVADEGKINAGQMIRQVAQHIKGGGGGQPHFATAGGKNPDGLDAAIAAARDIIAGA